MNHDVNILTLQERVRAALTMSESHFREFKSAWEGKPGEKHQRDPKTVKRDIGETLVAFANADGGELLVGVEDDGSISGVPHNEPIVSSFLDAWKTHVHPRTPLDRPVALQIELDGQKVLYFSVDKGTSYVHLTQDGRCLQRKDRESVPVASEIINFERQERLSREYDRGFVDGADATSLDAQALNATGKIVAPGLSAEKVLQLLGLAEYGGTSLRLRRAALLLFANDISLWHPRCEVRILRVSGTELKTGREYNVVDDKHVVGNIAELLQSAWDELRPYLVETRLGPDGRFQEQVRYPEDACREAVTNAIAHRDYTIEGRAIEVYVFDDRLEVRSPGALLSTVTLEGLRSLAGVHQSRNTALARTLRELGYMREMGEGFRRMFQLMRAHDLVEPEVIADANQFVVALRHRSVFSEEDQRWVSGFDDFVLARDEEKVLLLGRHGESLSVQQIMDAVDIVDTEDYRELIERLLNKGLLRGLKSAKSTGKQRRNSPRWEVIQPQAASKFLSELVMKIHSQVGGDMLTSVDYECVADSLSEDSPYRRAGGNLKKSMVTLGLVGQTGIRIGAVQVASRTMSPKHFPDAEPPNLSANAVTVNVVTEDEMKSVAEIANFRGSSLFVGNLAFSATAEDVKTVASDFGTVVSVRVPKAISSETGNRGFAFVQYASHEEAKNALHGIAGRHIRDRAVTVDWASSGRS